MSSGAKQHYVPAALIGGFGETADHKRPRDAVVCWRRRGWGVARETKAEAIGWHWGMYRLESPAHGLDPDVVDAVWDVIEPGISGAVRRFESGTDTAGEREWLVAYASMAGVRHPDFKFAINRWLAEWGKPGVRGDDVHGVRLEALGNGLVPMSNWRWRILHSPPEAPRSHSTTAPGATSRSCVVRHAGGAPCICRSTPGSPRWLGWVRAPEGSTTRCCARTGSAG